METLGIILIIVVFSLVAFGCCLSNAQNAQDEKKRLKENHIIYEQRVIHLGGHPYLKQNQQVTIQIRNFDSGCNELYINDKLICKDDIIRCEIKTEEQLSKDVTFGRLLALGVFAFAFKKNNVMTETFMVLSYKLEGVQVNCLFKGINSQQLTNFVFQINKLVLKNELLNTKKC